MQKTGTVTMKGNPLTLTGEKTNVGEGARNFQVLDNALKPVMLTDYQNKVLIIAAVPSLDTDVCSIETKRFNKEAQSLSNKIEVLTISMDLPFAQKRWVEEYKAENVTALSDHKDASFGRAFGVLIDELRLLARAVFVLDSDYVVRYVQIVDEVTDEPDYDAAIKAAEDLV